jgi:hypothetical protein
MLSWNSLTVRPLLITHNIFMGKTLIINQTQIVWEKFYKTHAMINNTGKRHIMSGNTRTQDLRGKAFSHSWRDCVCSLGERACGRHHLIFCKRKRSLVRTLKMNNHACLCALHTIYCQNNLACEHLKTSS